MKLDPTYAIKLLRPSRQGKDVCQRTLSRIKPSGFDRLLDAKSA